MRRIALMARVDFYLLKEAGVDSRYSFACRLAEKAYRLNNTVHIHMLSQSDVERVDDLLWTFRDGSFVPHDTLQKSESTRRSPVTIACGTAAVEPCDLLINLCDEIPEFAEIVGEDRSTIYRKIDQGMALPFAPPMRTPAPRP